MKLRQIAQKIEDPARAKAFYEKLLGQKAIAEFNPPGFVFFDLDGTRLLLDPFGKPALIYLEVDDVRETVERLRGEGFTIANEPHVVFPDPDGIFDEPGNEWLAFVEDTEGNIVGLMSREVL